jgi:acetyl-CoA carboxylase biotin carboxyl carrier protein
MAKITAKDVEALIKIFDDSDWDELHLEVDGFKIDLSKRHASGSTQPGFLDADTGAIAAPPPPPPGIAVTGLPVKEDGHSGSGQLRHDWVAVRAPNLGTFFRAPKPGAPPYVDLGQEVYPETEVCLIEVMKLFTAVVAKVHGVVREICVSDGDMVEYNQPLLWIEPKTAPANGPTRGPRGNAARKLKHL